MVITTNPFENNTSNEFFSYTEKKFPEYAASGGYRGGTGLTFSDILTSVSPEVRWMYHGERLGDNGLNISYGRDDKDNHYLTFHEYGQWSPNTVIEQYMTLETAMRIANEFKQHTVKTSTLNELVDVALYNMNKPKEGIDLEMQESTSKDLRELEWYNLFKSLYHNYEDTLTGYTKDNTLSASVITKLFNRFESKRIDTLGDFLELMIELLTIFPKVDFEGLDKYPDWLYEYSLHQPLNQLTADYFKNIKYRLSEEELSRYIRAVREESILLKLESILKDMPAEVTGIVYQDSSHYSIEIDLDILFNKLQTEEYEGKSVREIQLEIKKKLWKEFNLNKVHSTYNSTRIEISDIKDAKYPRLIVARYEYTNSIESGNLSNIWYSVE